MKRLRILVLAQQANPDWISVPLVGYQHAAALAEIHDVTLVTHFANIDAIQKRKAPYKDVSSISLGFWETFYAWCFLHIFKGNHGSQILTAFRIPFYWGFEWLAWKRYKARLKAGDFDLVLRVTPVAPVAPSLFSKRCKRIRVPFILGPINGGLPWPKGYPQAENAKEWVSHLRFLYKALPYARSTYRDASAIITGSSETFSDFRKYEEKLFFVPENGIRQENVVDRLQSPSRKGPLRLIFAGRLVPLKGADMVLRAASDLIRDGRASLTLVGDGEERQSLEKLAQSLGIKVEFTGMIPHAETMAHFRAADVLVFPSVREFGGGVVFEALSVGTVPIVCNYGGPGDIVQDGKTGFSVAMKGEDYTLAQIRKILERLDRQPELLSLLSKEGQRYAREELSWQGKARKMTEIFNWVLGLGPKPAFLPPRSFL